MNTTPGFLEIRLGAALRPQKSLSEIPTCQDLFGRDEMVCSKHNFRVADNSQVADRGNK